MSDWNPQIVKIEKVSKHAGADALSVVITSIGDYPIITKLDEYKPGDIAVYVPIDTIVPDTEEFHFLAPLKFENYEENGEFKKRPIGRKFDVGSVPESYRIIKAKKIRGQYSQGMLIPINWDVHIDPSTVDVNEYIARISVFLADPDFIGTNIASLYGFTKWEEDEEEASDHKPGANKKKAHAQNEKKPDGWTIPYYDIDSMRKFVASLVEGEEVILTEKIHGANAGFSHDGERLWVKSRNYYKRGECEIPIYDDGETVIVDGLDWQVPAEGYENLPRKRTKIGTKTVQSTDQWWEVARRIDLESKLAQYPGLVFFGEVYGQVTGFNYDVKIVNGSLNLNVRFFDIWDIKTMRYLDYDDYCLICSNLGLDMTPELYRGPWLGKEQMYPFAEGKTTLGGKHVREGFVLRTAKERYCERLKGRMQVKLVGEGYNLQK